MAAAHGGMAFIIAYIVITFLLAWPLLTLELSAGRFGRTDNVGIMQKMADTGGKTLATTSGNIALIFILTAAALYSVVGGWVLARLFDAILQLFQRDLNVHYPGNNYFWALAFLVINVLISTHGIRSGVELWARRLLPCLFILLLIMVFYVLQLNSASDGLKLFLTPDFSKVFKTDTLLAALGQSFFSLSLGGTTMLIYGSYLNRQASPPGLATQVVLADFLVSFLAGLIIVPLICSASILQGISIREAIQVSGPALAFDVLPPLFDSIGFIGVVLTILFFGLLWLASATSALSMIEVPVSRLQTLGVKRKRACYYSFAIISIPSLLLIYAGNNALSLTLKISTQLIQPLLAICVCIMAGWFWKRQLFLSSLNPAQTNSRFWKKYAAYIQYICPTLIIILLISLWNQ